MSTHQNGVEVEMVVLTGAELIQEPTTVTTPQKICHVTEAMEKRLQTG
jgi:hypothetical protein